MSLLSPRVESLLRRAIFLKREVSSMVVPYIFVIISGCLWGCLGTIFKGLQVYGVTSIEAAAFRQLIASILVGLVLLVKNRQAFRVTQRQLLPLILAGGVGSGIYNLVYFMAIDATSVSFAAALSYTAPAFVTIFSFFLFKEKLTGQKLISLLIMFIGCLFVTGVLREGGALYPPRGILLALAGGLSYSLYSLFLKMAVSRGCSSETASFYCLFFAFLMVAPFSGFWRVTAAFTVPGCSLLVLALGIFTAAIPSALYSWAMTRAESSKASMIASVDLVMATLLGVLLFNDPLSPAQFIGIALILGAVLLLSYQKTAKPNKVL